MEVTIKEGSRGGQCVKLINWFRERESDRDSCVRGTSGFVLKGPFDTSVFKGVTDALSESCSGRRWRRFLIGRTGPGPGLSGLMDGREVVGYRASVQEIDERE